MIELNIDYLKYSEIAQSAHKFLVEMELEEQIPVPVEEIVDLKLGINIVPLAGIQKVYEVEGFTSSDLSCIYVDDYVYSNRPTRYRFTLAHELGHIVLHGDLFKQFKFDEVEDWIAFVQKIDDKDYSKLEFQGYSFGGLILVPPLHLKDQFEENLYKLDPLIKEAQNRGVTKEEYLDYATNNIAEILAPTFDVSPGVVARRIKYDSLIDYIP